MADPGTALAIASMVFQLMAGCVQGFVLLSSARNIGKVGSELVCLLNIQEVRLIDWAKRSGLLAETPRLDARLNASLIESILMQLNGMLGDVDKLSTRYKFRLAVTSTDGQNAGQHAASGAGAAAGFIQGMVSDDTRGDILFRAQMIKSRNALPKRLWWAAVDSDKFKELVQTIQSLVQELWNLLDPLAHDDLARKMDQLLVHAIHRSDAIEDARTLQAAITLDARHVGGRDGLLLANVAGLRTTRLQAGGDLADENDDDDDNEPLQTARVRSSTTTTITTPLARETLLDFAKVSHFAGMDGNADMGPARYDGGACFVEFRTLPAAPGARAALLTRAKNLVRFLTAPKHPAFRLLRCRGVAIAPDEARLYFVFDLPQPSTGVDGEAGAEAEAGGGAAGAGGEQQPQLRPVSLLSLLSSTSGPLPSINARLRLASRLLAAMRYTHAAGWLHRNIRSQNVVFFVPAAAASAAAAPADTWELTAGAQPILTGFAYARLGRAAGLSERGPAVEPARDIYRHPAWLGENGALKQQRSQPWMDVYALGTVLLELAVWKPLARVVKGVVDVRAAAAAASQQQQVVIRDEVLRVSEFLREGLRRKNGSLYLPFRMGEVYARVVGECLEIGAVGAEESLDLLEAAVNDLRKCSV